MIPGLSARAVRKFVTTIAAGIGLQAASLTAQAAIVNAVFTNLGGGHHYSAGVEVVNDGAPATLSAFTLYFDETRYTNFFLTGSPSTWDTLLIQPDLGIPAAGFLDSFAIDPLDALQLGQSQAGFSFTFDYIGQGLPGGMTFDINDADFNVLFSGRSADTFVTTNTVPEPGGAWLVLAALAGIGFSLKRAGRSAVAAHAGASA